MRRFFAWLRWLIDPPKLAETPPPPIARIEVWYSTYQQRWYWRKKSIGNNEIISSGESNGYHNKQDCLATVAKYEPGLPVRELPSQ